ncbi:zinc finger, CCHC-type containing protein [Tanacetum coccineum]
MLKLLGDATVEAIRIRAKWENDDYICRGHILNGMSDSLFYVYTNVESAKELWDSLESKYMAEDSSSKKFILPPSWKDFKHTLKHGKDDLSLVQLGSHLRIEESLRAQDSNKGKGKEVAGPSVNMTEEESRDAIFDENHFSSIRRPKDIIPNSDESQRDDHSDDLRDQEIKLDHNTLTVIVLRRILEHESMQSRDFAFWKEAIDDEIGSIMENNTWVLSDLPPGGKPLGCKVDGTFDKFKARLVIQGFRQKEGIDYFDTYAPVTCFTTIRLLLALAAIHNLVIHQMDVKIAFLNGDLDEEVYMKQSEGFVMLGNEHKFSMKDIGEADVILGIKIKRENKGILKYSRVIGCLMYAMTSTRPVIAYAVGRLSRLTSNPKGYSDASWINHVKDSSSTSGWVFLPRGGAISWASKKQTCITGSTMESEFVALAAAGKEAEWLRNLIHEIPIWPKPIAPISIRCDSAPTMAKAYSQIYNGKSRHLGVRHSMIRELIMNGVISIEFVRSQKNLADHLTKGLARDLVNKSVIGMGLKSI